MRSTLLTSLSLLFSSALATAQPLLVSGTIYTSDATQPVVEAVVIEDGRFQFVGDLSDAEAFAGEDAQRLELGARIAYPGFIEGHGHFASFGKAMSNLDLNKVDSFQDIVTMVAEASAKAAPGQVIEGRGWHQSKWNKTPPREVDGFPTHHALSEVSPNNPVVLGHANGHSLIMNAKAMEMVGITDITETPEGGVIVRDTKGSATGVLHENAMDMVEPLTTYTAQSARAATLTAQDVAIASGITGFHDAGIGTFEIDAQQSLDAEGLLKIRLYSMVSASNPVLAEQWINRPPVVASGDKRLTIRSFKVVMDGALGSRTAWLHEPYTDDPSTAGVQTFDPATLVELFRQSKAHGWQINTHAIGDKANSVVLDAIAEAELGDADHRSRIEHSQHLLPEDVQRFADLGVIASVQTVHLSSDRPWAINRLGEDRIKSGAYIWRALIDGGVAVANGTDVPVEPINPFATFYSAITRKTLAGTPDGGFESAQRMTRQEALASMTLWNAYAAFQEHEVGSIEVGKLADMTVLSQDIMTIDEAVILDTDVAMTMIGGEILYQR